MAAPAADAKDIEKLAPQASLFCAKPIKDLNVIEKLILLAAPTIPSTGGFLPALWQTKTIPVYLGRDVESDAKLKQAVLNALRYLNNYSGASFRVCKAEFIQKTPAIRSAIRITGALPCPSGMNGLGANGCTIAGMALGNRPSGQAAKRDSKGETETNWPYGGTVRLRRDERSFSEGVIVHEILHALGMVHSMQTDNARQYLKFKGDNYNFTLAPKAFQLETFDPTSIMMYDMYTPAAGDIRYVCDKELQEKSLPLVKVEGCKLNQLVESVAICRYRGPDCFQKPAAYSINVEGGIMKFSQGEGQRQCMSVLDQAWVHLALKAIDAKDDLFGLEAAVKSGDCSIP